MTRYKRLGEYHVQNVLNGGHHRKHVAVAGSSSVVVDALSIAPSAPIVLRLVIFADVAEKLPTGLLFHRNLV